jgi:uncharacterized protein YndB with AHSA1/START domain
MSSELHLQVSVDAPIATVFHALTDAAALEAWFAEHARVSLSDGRYDFWGRFTPEEPSEEVGRHPIDVAEPPNHLQYRWPLRGVDTTVAFRLAERDGRTTVGVWHHSVPGARRDEAGSYGMNDLWSLWLENLRRYVEGRPTVRCDFSLLAPGDFTHAVEIDGTPDEVWTALVDPTTKQRWIAHGPTAEPQPGATWIDWGEGVGALEILQLVPTDKLVLKWEIDGQPTIVTWRVEGSGGKARLTLTHSGFGPDRRTDAEWAGWLEYLIRVKSLVEYGADWVPPLADVARDVALYYAASIWARQDEFLGAEAWTHVSD